MKILLIQPYLARKLAIVFPLGIANLLPSLQDHQVSVLDMNTVDDPYAELTSKLEELEPEVVGISLRNIDDQNRIDPCYYYLDFKKIIKLIKETSPESKLVVGGTGFSMFARTIMERNEEIDFGVVHDGEESFPELLANIDHPEQVKGIYYRSNGGAFYTGPRPLPSLENRPIAPRDFIDQSPYKTEMISSGVETKRGCQLGCTYCNYPKLSGARIRLRDPKQVVDEIQEMKEKHGIDSFVFTDPVFNHPRDYAARICQEIIARDLKVTWGAYIDTRFSDEDFLMLAWRAGCKEFVFSFDAVSDSALKGLNKGITRKDIDDVVTIFRNNPELKEAKFLFCFFFNGPGETLRGLIQAIFYSIKIRREFKGRGDSFFHFIRIEPETKLYELALKTGLLKPDSDLLPETMSGLDRTYFSQPPLNRLDFLILGAERFLGKLGGFLAKFRGKNKQGADRT